MAASTAVATDLLTPARLAYARQPESAYAGAQLLRQLRGSRADRLAVYREARPIWQKFSNDQWVNRHFSWICYDLLKCRIERDELHAVPDLIQELLALAAKTGEQPDMLVRSTANLFGRAVKRARQRSGALTQLWARLAEVGMPLAANALPLLPREPQPGPDGKPLPSEHDRLIFHVRRAADQGQRWELLEALCLKVINEQWPAADPKWFVCSYLDAAAHSVPACVAPDSLAALLDRYGDDEHVQLALARWRAALADAAGATAGFNAAVALTRSPWAWHQYAQYLERCGDHTDAVACLRAGLALSDPAKPGFVWKIHFQLARLLLETDEAEAAVEVALARWCRQEGGWGPDGALERFVAEHKGLHEQSVETGSRLGRALLAERRRVYREAREASMRAFASLHVVIRADLDRGLVWMRPIDGSNQPSLLRHKVGRRPPPREGESVLAISVRSWDARRGCPGRKVAWWCPSKDYGTSDRVVDAAFHVDPALDASAEAQLPEDSPVRRFE